MCAAIQAVADTALAVDDARCRAAIPPEREVSEVVGVFTQKRVARTDSVATDAAGTGASAVDEVLQDDPRGCPSCRGDVMVGLSDVEEHSPSNAARLREREDRLERLGAGLSTEATAAWDARARAIAAGVAQRDGGRDVVAELGAALTELAAGDSEDAEGED